MKSQRQSSTRRQSLHLCSASDAAAQLPLEVSKKDTVDCLGSITKTCPTRAQKDFKSLKTSWNMLKPMEKSWRKWLKLKRNGLKWLQKEVNSGQVRLGMCPWDLGAALRGDSAPNAIDLPIRQYSARPPQQDSITSQSRLKHVSSCLRAKYALKV